jgi:DNA-binding transcriptional MerR regulator
MRSAELAQVAGVTVRTLRHYHQLGILPEPPRSTNGYREYTIRDLVRVLRIKNLSTAGVPLDSAARMIDDENTDSDFDSVLDDIDRALESKIAELSAQRSAIAAARAAKTTPDLPSELLRFVEFLSGSSPSTAAAGREQLALLANLDHQSGATNVATLLEHFLPMREQLVSLTERFEFVTNHEDDIARLVADFRTFRESTVETFPADQLEWMQTPRFLALLESYERDTFTPGQAAVMAALADDPTDEIDSPSS